MDIQDTKEQRQAFEAWCIQWNIASVFPLDNDGQYKEYDIHLLYCAWLQGQAAKAQAVPEWISVKRGMPKAGSRVLTYDDYGFADVATIDGCEDQNNVYFSYWLLLPDAPIKAQESAND